MGFWPTGKDGFKRPQGEDAVDWRIRVWWKDDKCFYGGYVVSFRDKSGRHKVEYDDGEVEWLNLDTEEAVEWFIPASANLKKLGLEKHASR